ncbi:MAG: hypothetical protein A3D16_19465 [Rhodobacterales bacterium RIFCSPHIGHO2_02_FULL_62_130]|nr:MAG: hypothetical protein A3D16_19465 [Rhodobacterales bacterium RIFCSPHIGHO2_02_FULL_62_130]OHC56982.1 MAG: hypothetical protein A3E48_11710 [Rhodobacterales bacterium RIFCSPHIGHO2_12_FULL_62_75]
MGLSLSSAAISDADDTDGNVKVMIDAARQLTWDSWMGDNRASLLVKQETVVAPVAVVFGYADNAAACEELARVLSQSQLGVGTFKCQPIF